LLPIANEAAGDAVAAGPRIVPEESVVGAAEVEDMQVDMNDEDIRRQLGSWPLFAEVMQPPRKRPLEITDTWEKTKEHVEMFRMSYNDNYQRFKWVNLEYAFPPTHHTKESSFWTLSYEEQAVYYSKIDRAEAERAAREGRTLPAIQMARSICI